MLLCLLLLAFLHSCLVFQVFIERSHNVQSPELSGLTRLRTTGRHRCFRVHTGSVTLAKIGCPSTLEMAQIVQFGKPEARHLSQHLARAEGALGSCACGGRARWQRGVGMRPAVEVEPHGTHDARAVVPDELGHTANSPSSAQARPPGLHLLHGIRLPTPQPTLPLKCILKNLNDIKKI